MPDEVIILSVGLQRRMIQQTTSHTSCAAAGCWCALSFPRMRTPEQQQRLNEIEQELLNMAHKAEEETKTVLRGK